MEKEIEIWYSEYELRQFIDMALRWKIEGVYNSRTENRPFSIFQHYVENARDNFELFSTQLNKKLTKTENWRAIEIDLKDRFLLMIDGYLNWYEQNKAELVKFEPYCPYTIMLSIIESTKAEILKYFPQNNKPLPPEQTENDFTLSTIEDWLFEFKEKMEETDYQTLVSALKQYFDIGTFPTLTKPIQINGRPNIKLFGWALNRIFEAKGKGIEKELLQFAKQNISLFTDVPFDETNIFKSNLYKYFTTRTK
jgi:hypothetical protein